METGRVKRIVKDRGFGFITPSSGSGADVFFHATQLTGGLFFAEDLVGRPVTFEREEQPDGRQRAMNVRAA